MAKRTDKDMLESGSWNVVGKKGGKRIFRHHSGLEISYDCNAWLWVNNETRDRASTLEVALYFAQEHLASQNRLELTF